MNNLCLSHAANGLVGAQHMAHSIYKVFNENDNNVTLVERKCNILIFDSKEEKYEIAYLQPRHQLAEAALIRVQLVRHLCMLANCVRFCEGWR